MNGIADKATVDVVKLAVLRARERARAVHPVAVEVLDMLWNELGRIHEIVAVSDE